MKLIIEKQDWASMPALPNDFNWSSFAEATIVIPGTTNHKDNIFEYHADLKRDWCIHSIPNGGYVTSLLLVVVQNHFSAHHAQLNQPDPITFHTEFLSPTASGPCTISVYPLKLGRHFSTLRVQLLQPSSSPPSPNPSTPVQKICIEAIITVGNLTSEAKTSSVKLDTRPILQKDKIPKRSTCEEWAHMKEWTFRIPAMMKAQYYLPPGSDSLLAHPTLGPSVRESWLKWKPENGASFDLPAVAFLADAIRPLIEAYGEDMKGTWYPTLSYNMDFRRKWKEGKEGWEWLFLRAELRECWGGRFGMVVVIADEEGDVVATCSHTALVMGLEKNLKGNGESKI